MHTHTQQLQRHTKPHTHTYYAHTKRESHASLPPLAGSWCLWPPQPLYQACDVPDVMCQVGQSCVLIQKKQEMPLPHPAPKVNTPGSVCDWCPPHISGSGRGMGPGCSHARWAPNIGPPQATLGTSLGHSDLERSPAGPRGEAWVAPGPQDGPAKPH